MNFKHQSAVKKCCTFSPHFVFIYSQPKSGYKNHTLCIWSQIA
ncbi:hypothetical protein HMPREF9065_01909 [Aggregatibacter sp. oral taxon 458 str. W10330]|nr:hypothetical protein HMPREF9065_01909 [Aggregatibacter sp. oral taxon 458 str. W10330]